MYSHVQLNEQGGFLRFIPAGENIEWDANNYCSAFALERDGKADQFRVKPFYTSAQPAFDSITQAVKEVDPAPVDGLWTQQWEVIDLDAEAIAANQATKAAADLAAAKAARQGLVDAITVTTASGKVFDGNEVAQRRMTSAITGMDDGEELPWVLHDSTVAVVTRAELREALRLAGADMASIWVAPYQPA
jgi:hypothetical protein